MTTRRRILIAGTGAMATSVMGCGGGGEAAASSLTTDGPAPATAPLPPVTDSATPIAGILLEDSGSGVSSRYFHNRLLVPWRGSFTGALLGSKVANAVGEVQVDLPSAHECVVIQTNPSNRWVQLRSRESGVNVPQLRVIYTDGTSDVLACLADAQIDPSNANGVGEKAEMTLGTAVLRFATHTKPVASAKLVLYVFAHYGSPMAIEVREFLSPILPAPAPVFGLRRAGLSGPSLIKHEDFSSSKWWLPWYTSWAPGKPYGTRPTAAAFDIVTTDLDTGDPLGYAAYLVAGGPNGTTHVGEQPPDSPAWWFPDHEGSDREEVYFQYRLRMGEGWRGGTLQSGKLPGIMGDNTLCDSGVASNGKNGWHFRMGFEGEPFEAASPYKSENGVVPVGWYTYNPEQAAARTTFGIHMPWTGRGSLGLIEIGKDYWIDMYVKVNTPGQRNGIVRGWIDGQLAFERTDYLLRDVPPYTAVGNNAIQRVWMVFLHGGSILPRPTKILRTYWSNWTIATEYIGPP
jgi:hypothetical protein